MRSWRFPNGGSQLYEPHGGENLTLIMAVRDGKSAIRTDIVTFPP